MKKLTRGVFIVFCGPEGGGKSTQIKWLAKYLTRLGYDVYTTNELRKTPVGKGIRNVTNLDVADGIVELFLFCAARRHNNVRHVYPALRDKKIVICDRYIMDTYAYQCEARNALTDREFKYILDRTVADVWVPDLSIWMHLKPSIGIKRKIKQGSIDRFESEDLAFHEAVARGFATFFKKWPEYRNVCINAERDKKHIHNAIVRSVLPLLRQLEELHDPA